jgi:hypothetical protein
MPGDLGVSTLRLIQTMPSFFFSFRSIKPAMLMLGDYSTSACRTPLVFLVVPTCWETCFSSRRYSTYFFFFFWIIIPAILPATMLEYYSMSASFMPSEFFHYCFDLLETCFL